LAKREEDQPLKKKQKNARQPAWEKHQKRKTPGIGKTVGEKSPVIVPRTPSICTEGEKTLFDHPRDKRRKKNKRKGEYRRTLEEAIQLKIEQLGKVNIQKRPIGLKNNKKLLPVK